MISFFDWFSSQSESKTRPWLILGKGPSFSKRQFFDLSRFYTLSLNHAVREQPVTVAHIIDFNVVEACSDCLETNAQVVVLPWVPHVNNRAGEKTLLDFIEISPVLRRLNEQHRLLYYNLSTGQCQRAGSPVVQVRYFSAEAALNLLTTAEVKQVRSLGIDGGVDYSQDFADLKGKTLLANSRTSFNKQFEEIAKTILRTQVDYAPLDVESPVRVYVAATEAEMLPVKILEFSIRKHASMSVEVKPIYQTGIKIPLPKDPENLPRTPFSFQRFLIPEVVGYKGRAIYLDADMQVFKDIRGLWMRPFNGADILAVEEPVETGRRPQFSVMVLNCDSLKWKVREIVDDLDKGVLTYAQLMYEMTVAKSIDRCIDPAWNSLERYAEGKTALLHYTDMHTQPWVSQINPLGYLWVRDLFEAIDLEVISEGYVSESVGKGFVRPSLLYQIEHRIEDALLLPRKARLMDEDFNPPYKKLPQHGSSPWLSCTHRLKAMARHYYQQSRLEWAYRKWRNYTSR
jgi:Glycosyl transferase family 8